MIDDVGVSVASGTPLAILWEREGKVVRWVFASTETQDSPGSDAGAV